MLVKVEIRQAKKVVFSVTVDVQEEGDLPAGVKTALEQFRIANPNTSLLDDAVEILFDKA